MSKGGNIHLFILYILENNNKEGSSYQHFNKQDKL